MNELIIASNNKNKIREIRQIMYDMDLRVLSLFEAGMDINPEENGNTFAENALIKARAVYEASGIPVIADDSGLVVDELDGEPGIYSKRYAGADATDTDNNEMVCNKLLEKGMRSSKASFVCSIAYIDDKGDEHLFEGKCTGEFISNPRGVNGFGYDPHFYVRKYDKTMAEMDDESKNSISHRGRALADLLDFMKGV